jgi:hypothetical protein
MKTPDLMQIIMQSEFESSIDDVLAKQDEDFMFIARGDWQKLAWNHALKGKSISPTTLISDNGYRFLGNYEKSFSTMIERAKQRGYKLVPDTYQARHGLEAYRDKFHLEPGSFYPEPKISYWERETRYHDRNRH